MAAVFEAASFRVMLVKSLIIESEALIVDTLSGFEGEDKAETGLFATNVFCGTLASREGSGVRIKGHGLLVLLLALLVGVEALVEEADLDTVLVGKSVVTVCFVLRLADSELLFKGSFCIVKTPTPPPRRR